MKALVVDYAIKAHAGQRRSTGEMYIYHPIAVATYVDYYAQLHDQGLLASRLIRNIKNLSEIQELKEVCMLHDVLEDNPSCYNDLIVDNILRLSPEQQNALLALTHDKDVPYMDYIKNIVASGNRYAIITKLLDMQHNSLTGTEKQLKKYEEAIQFINDHY